MMGVPDGERAGITGRRAASVCASRSCSRLRGARVVIAGRRAAQRQAQAARLGSKAEFVRRRGRCVDERWAQLTGPRDVEELPQPPAEPAGCARHAQAICPASGERRCSRGDHDARGPSWTLGPGAARIKERLRLLQMPGYAMLPLAGASLFEAVTATTTAPASSRPAAPPCPMRAQYPAAVTRGYGCVTVSDALAVAWRRER